MPVGRKVLRGRAVRRVRRAEATAPAQVRKGRRDIPGRLACKECRAVLALRARAERKALLAARVRRGHKASLVRKAPLGCKAQPDRLEPRVRRVIQARQDLQVHKAHLVQPGHRARPEIPGLKGYRVHPESRAAQALKVR